MKSKVSFVSIFAIALWGCTMLAGFVRAQQDSKPATFVINSDDDLKTVLDNLGLEPKQLSAGYLVSVKQDTWTFHIQFVVSGDKTKVGLNANLGEVKDPTAVTAAEWLDILKANEDLEPSIFYFGKKLNKLYLHRTFDNRALTPAIVKRELDNFCGHIKTAMGVAKFVK